MTVWLGFRELEKLCTGLYRVVNALFTFYSIVIPSLSPAASKGFIRQVNGQRVNYLDINLDNLSTTFTQGYASLCSGIAAKVIGSDVEYRYANKRVRS